MAYKQNPGRGNNAKTGYGLPTPFKQEGPKTKKTNEEIAKKLSENKFTNRELTSASKFAKGSEGTGMLSGTKVNKITKQAEPKGYEKKLITSPSGDVSIVSGEGKTIKSAKYSKFKPEAAEALKKEYEKEKSFTEDSRKANSNYQNYRLKLGGGSKRMG